jgi:hypothetical protein
MMEPFMVSKISKRRERYSLVHHDMVVDTDVCDSGAAGAILGEKLANGGSDGPDNSRSVVILEKGGYYDAEDTNREK